MQCITIPGMEIKDTQIIVRLNSKIREKLQKRADKEGRTISNLVRYILQKELKKKR